MSNSTNKTEAIAEEAVVEAAPEAVVEAVVDAVVEEAVVEAALDVVDAPEPPQLTIQDLGNLRNILDVAAKRGVFKTEEFSIVGETFTKLSNFIAAITPPAEKPADGVAEDAEKPAAK